MALDIKKLEEEIKEEQQNSDKQPKTMNELKQLVALRGEQWRADTNHQYENTKTGEIKAYRPDPSQTASELLKLCSFTLIGKGKSDKSPLYLYNPETGLYTDSDDMIDALIYAFDSRIDVNTYQKVKHIIRIESKFREQLSSKELLPVGNGILNKETKELHPFSPQYILTSKIATAYNPDVTPPTFGGKFNFNDWLKEIACNDEEVITLLWQVMNEAINPLQTRGKLVILTGSGNNGKGTFQDLLKNLVGEGNYSTLRPEQFKGFELGSLIGKTLNIGDDIENSFLPEVSNLKTITSGDALTINEKYGRVYELELKLLCMFSANEIPKTKDRTNGWYRRLCIIPFEADFNGKKENKAIKQVYLKDKQLLEWVLVQIVNMKPFDKFIEPKRVTMQLRKYKKDNDVIRAFVEDIYIPNGWHECTVVPIWFIKEHLEEYISENEITTQKSIKNIGGGVIEALKELTGVEYRKNRTTVRKEDYQVLYYNPNNPSGYPSKFKQSYDSVEKQ
ncbi:DNA primase family protein [Streptococcus ruminicola]|uniref:DNA primase family protein n=1 Tax=Streptococcus ruminicola TaxID=2686210 RepID=UPI0012FAD620|nr:DNA primase family protein [Streptococcus ruminicola]QGW99814.1 DNA primase [Streptococcus ruminicola]